MERLVVVRHLDGCRLREHEARTRRDQGVGDLLCVARGARSEGITGRERLVDGLVVRVPVIDAEGRERFDERLLRGGERDAVLRSAWAGERRLHRGEVELDDLRVRRRLVGVVPERVLLAVRLDEGDPLVRAPGQPQVAKRLRVDREEAARGAVLGRHVPDRRPVGEREGLQAVAEVLDELADDARLSEDLRDREHEVGGRRRLRQRTRQAEADDLRDEHGDRLAEHGGLGLDPADSPAEDAEPVDHGRVRVRPDERVGKGDTAALVDDAREELEVHLVDDPGARRHGLEIVERSLSPAQERVALAVSLELELGVPEDRDACSRTRRPARSGRSRAPRGGVG